jgi:hypothetical protein
VTPAQGRFVLRLVVCVIAVAAWLASWVAYPGKGLLRTAVLFGLVIALLAPYRNDYLRVVAERPYDPARVGGGIAIWLMLVLAAVLLAQASGYRIPVGRGVNRPIGYLVLVAPFLAPVVWRFLQIYPRLRSQA